MNTPKLARMAAPLALLLGGLGSPGLMAQEGPYSYQLKLRVGLVGGDIQQAHYDNKMLGFAAEVRRDIKGLLGGLQGSLLAEVAWEFVPSRHHDVYPWGANPFVRMDGSPLDIRYSADDRKEYGQGLNLKLGYASKMPQVFGTYGNEVARDMEWFAGIALDRYRVRSEVRYVFRYNTGASAVTGNNNGQYDGGTFVQEGSQFVPGAFVGLRYNVRQDFGFELALRNLGMWHYEFTPASYRTGGYWGPDSSRFGNKYNGQPDSWATESTGTSRGWALDFAITARF